MKNNPQKFTVTSAGWEIEVDDINPRSAALSAMIMAFKKYRDSLLLSTTIMVSPTENFNSKNMKGVSFFASHDILFSMGINNLAQGLLSLTALPRNELKSFK